MFSSIIDTVAAKAAAGRTVGEYQDERGVWRCTVCNEKSRCAITIPGHGTQEVAVECGCDRRERDAQAKRGRLEEIELKRRICFPSPAMRAWTFAADDGNNQQLSTAARNYAGKFPQFRKDGKGLLLYGTVGTGKSFAAACIANQVIEDGFTSRMTNFATIINDCQGFDRDRNEYIAELIRYDLLILDDLGAERNSAFAREIVFNVVDARYTAGLPLVVTTNLSGAELKQPQDISLSRIYDRLLQRCFPFEVSGKSRRKQDLKDNFAAMQEALGLGGN